MTSHGLYLLFCSFCFNFFLSLFSPLILFMLTFAEESLKFKWISAYWVCFSWLMPLVFYLQNHCQTQGHLSFILCYFFKVLHFTIRSVIHYESLKMEWLYLDFFLNVDVQLLQYHIVKRLFLLHYMAFAPLLRVSWLHYLSLFKASVLFHCLSFC